MVYGYVRVSTHGQTIENQKYEITKTRNIDKWYEETEHGTVDYKNRILNKCIKQLKKDDILVVSELSRLGRSLYMIMEILNHVKTIILLLRKNLKISILIINSLYLLVVITLFQFLYKRISLIIIK